MIVIPMAGLSSRFFNAGYEKPKYMLEAGGKTLFDHAVLSFEKYFTEEMFLFIVRDAYDTPQFVSDKCKNLGILNFRIVVLENETRGQAETVALGIEGIDSDTALTIFNIDTFRPGFSFPEQVCSDGYLEVFEGSGSNWSFVAALSPDQDKVIKTTEKNPISNLCSTGLYFFRKASYFNDAYKNMINTPKAEWEKGELYIAPLYNYLISRGDNIRYHLIDYNEVVFCGTPSEYERILNEGK
jgi:dTDP-glucose pyrophosphorylase